jgi:hypothetical protein
VFGLEEYLSETLAAREARRAQLEASGIALRVESAAPSVDYYRDGAPNAGRPLDAPPEPPLLAPATAAAATTSTSSSTTTTTTTTTTTPNATEDVVQQAAKKTKLNEWILY